LTLAETQPIAEKFEMAKEQMARSSPGVLRVAAILNFFAEHPGQAFTLTDLVRALRLSRATCHALLTGLVEVGYLYRANDKNYVLGPALINIARVAAEHASPMQVAQPEMRALADEFDGFCSAFYRDRDEVVVRERAASGTHLGWSAPPGTRMKLRPPFGAIFFAWSPRAEAEAWLEAVSPTPTPEQHETMLRSMAFARDHGFAFGVRGQAHAGGSLASAEQVFGGQQSDVPVAHLTEIDPDREYQLAFALAPVFDDKGHVAFVLGLMGVGGRPRGAEVERMGRKLRESCDRITNYLGGRQPQAQAA
jgi:DNA-binding IclR family transcriptional regulator